MSSQADQKIVQTVSKSVKKTTDTDSDSDSTVFVGSSASVVSSIDSQNSEKRTLSVASTVDLKNPEKRIRLTPLATIQNVAPDVNFSRLMERQADAFEWFAKVTQEKLLYDKELQERWEREQEELEHSRLDKGAVGEAPAQQPVAAVKEAIPSAKQPSVYRPSAAAATGGPAAGTSSGDRSTGARSPQGTSGESAGQVQMDFQSGSPENATGDDDQVSEERETDASESEGEMSGDELEDVLAEYSDGEDENLTDPIHNKLVMKLSKWINSKQNPKEIKEVCASLKKPKNAECLSFVNVNKQIYTAISSKLKESDRKIKQHANLILRSLWPAAINLHKMVSLEAQLKKNEKGHRVLRHGPIELDITEIRRDMDKMIRLSCAAYSNLTFLRRTRMKSAISYQFGNICNSDYPFTTELFGDDLDTKLTKLSSASKIRIRRQTRGRPYSRGDNRFKHSAKNGRGYFQHRPPQQQQQYGRSPQYSFRRGGGRAPRRGQGPYHRTAAQLPKFNKRQ